jgi:hypothetical protein
VHAGGDGAGDEQDVRVAGEARTPTPKRWRS